VSNFVSAIFDDQAARGSITRFELRQAYERHTLAIVDMSVATSLLRTTGGALYPEMTSVVLQWGRSATEQSRFFGYVNHCEVLTDDDGVPTVRYLCLGTSLRMNGSDPRAWSNVTPSFAAAEISRKHRMRALLHRSTRTLPTFTITTESDFQALQRLAAETGFRLWVDGGTVLFVDPNVLLLGATTTFVPKYSTVTDFEVTSGTLAPRSGGVVSEKIVLGRSAATKGAFTVRSNTVLKTRPDDTVGFKPALTTVLPGEVTSYSEARDRLATANRLQNWLTATVRLPGAPLLRPGKLVWIDGPRVPVEHTGVWHIESTRHVMNINRTGTTAHSTDVEMSRNQGVQPDFTRTAQLSGTPDVVGCVRRDGVFWESESLDIVQLN
jgi:phage protein D